ncbi:glycoside hydrolase family 43 protein [Cellvibrio sp. ARAG 10.3]|uniref:glycoside hydrolase family 43 protein n=1 Tax=Cellvibrio sp. ARAG 10.3 TaxID=3451358 RepID=UPI003F447D48
MNSAVKFFVRVFCVLGASLCSVHSLAGNPIHPGWYADPEIRIFNVRYWIYPTYSAGETTPDLPITLTEDQRKQRSQPGIWSPFLKQTFLDAFSSPDLVNWTRHPRVLDIKDVDWAAYAVWAPSAVTANGKYYLFFSANNILDNSQLGGIGVAVSDQPEGPFRDALGKPLIGQIHKGAQPIDQMVFQDDDGQFYLYYGGWKRCNVVKLSKDLLSLEPFADGEFYKEITPHEDYVEGAFMVKRKGIYYLMWSEGEWTGPDYSVAYAMASSPLGPFERIGKILQQDTKIARGAGHHSVVNIPGTDDWYIVYHRRPLDSNDGNHRLMAIEHLYFNKDGSIKPVVMTNEGIAPVPLLKP